MTFKIGKARELALAASLTLAGCATLDVRPGVVRHETPRQIREKFRGPEVSIRAARSGTRTTHFVQPMVSLADSAYIVVGDIGDDGTLRILFPANPGDSNFVRTDKFSIPGFTPRMYFPLSTQATMAARTTAIASGGTLFVIASRTPLQLEKLAEGEQWSLFDVYYEQRGNPWPAITDLAAAISPNVRDVQIAYSGYASNRLETISPQRGANVPATTRRLPRPPAE